jgi:hypothetical protein
VWGLFTDKLTLILHESVVCPSSVDLISKIRQELKTRLLCRTFQQHATLML